MTEMFVSNATLYVEQGDLSFRCKLENTKCEASKADYLTA